MKYRDKVKRDEERNTRTMALKRSEVEDANSLENEEANVSMREKAEKFKRESQEKLGDIKGKVGEFKSSTTQKFNDFKKRNRWIIKALKTNIRFQIFVAVCLILIILLFAFIGKGIKTMKYHRTDEYKLLSKGYTAEEVKSILTFDQEKLDFMLKSEYNASLDDFIQEKYYMESNLKDYLTFKDAYPTVSYSDIVSRVNTNRDREFYSDTENADISKGEKVLVNKYYLLSSDYVPTDLENIPLSYAYAGRQLSKVALEPFIEMCKAAKSAGFTIVADVGYRTYSRQQQLWDDVRSEGGSDYADQVAARAGASDHQTGLAVNVLDFNDPTTSFDKTAAYNWMNQNAHLYGFIERYPNYKSEITGFAYEPGHYRYVGVEVATAIHNSKITFDEYYAYYIEGK